MNTNRWLAAAVAALALALAAQSLYLWSVLSKDREKQEQAASGPTSAVSRSRVPASALPLRYADPWSDPVFNSGADAWDPFEEMDQIQKRMNRMFRDSFSRGGWDRGLARSGLFYEPDLDVQETDDAYLLRLDLPGIDKDKISVKVQNHVLTVSGERKSEREESEPGGAFYRMERSFGSFTRSFPLPPDAEAGAMTAESMNGVLTIRLPKTREAAPDAQAVPVK